MTIQKADRLTGTSDRTQLIIENEFQLADSPINLWFVIRLAEGSFLNLLDRVEYRNDFKSIFKNPTCSDLNCEQS